MASNLNMNNECIGTEEEQEKHVDSLEKLAQESFLAGSRAGIKAITDGFRVVAIRDIPGQEKRFTALEIVGIIKGMESKIKGF